MKRQKATLTDLYDLNVRYHATQRVKDKQGNFGTRYILSKELTSEQKALLQAFKNIHFSTCYYKYAPEIVYDTVVIMDKCKSVKGAKV